MGQPTVLVGASFGRSKFLLFVFCLCAVNVYVPKDRVTSLHQGYGFVEFRSEDDADYVSTPLLHPLGVLYRQVGAGFDIGQFLICRTNAVGKVDRCTVQHPFAIVQVPTREMEECQDCGLFVRVIVGVRIHAFMHGSTAFLSSRGSNCNLPKARTGFHKPL
jgi:hypothetical protein